jgi:lipoic acid synthetase
MGLQHAHVTMVNRDDLRDGGASLMAATVRAIRRDNPGCSIEVLCSDFMGDPEAIRLVVESRPDILSHNLETVRRLTPLVRSRSDYDRSLAFLRLVRESDPATVTKSSLMLGLGESLDEVLEAMHDLREAGTDMLNLGQYLQPSRTHLPVACYWSPEEFARLRVLALRLGFRHCESGPLVRSSYHAGQQLRDLRLRAADRPGAVDRPRAVRA